MVHVTWHLKIKYSSLKETALKFFDSYFQGFTDYPKGVT